MNEETTVPTEETVPESIEPLATETQETAPEATDGTVATDPTVPETSETVPEESTPEETEETYYEDLSGAATEETTELVIVDVIESVGSDIVHANLFSGFLICGTLVGIAILRKIHGT